MWTGGHCCPVVLAAATVGVKRDEAGVWWKAEEGEKNGSRSPERSHPSSFRFCSRLVTGDGAASDLRLFRVLSCPFSFR